MKLLLAIINKDDTRKVTDELSRARFFVTKVATTGGFLQKGNTTLLLGTENSRVDEAVRIIKTNGKRRVVRTTLDYPASPALGGAAVPIGNPIEITVGGATIFVMDIERYEHE